MALRRMQEKTVAPSPNFSLPACPGGVTVGRGELDQIFQLAYEELRRLASAVKRRDQSATLTPTALVHEAWVKLASSPAVGASSELHFKRIAARAMRQLLVEAARRRKAEKRGGGNVHLQVACDEARDVTTAGAAEVIALHEALNDLAAMDERQAQMVELRFFAGFDIASTAAILRVSEETVHRDWRAAKAWLNRRLRPSTQT